MARTRGEATLELVADARATLGEGPAWDAVRGLVWWVDISGRCVHRFDPRDGSDAAIEVGSPVGMVALRRDGTLLLALADGLATLDPDAAEPHPEPLLALGRPGDGLRCNDGKPDPEGRLWLGRLAMDLAPGAGTLLRIDPGLDVTTRMTGLTIPNGLGWSPDGRTMYYVDSAWGEVRAYPCDPETGLMGDGRRLARLAGDGIVPDGLTVDAEGHLWVALWGGGRVVRVAPDGAIVDRVDLPITRVTSCAFGGDDLGDLYITTAREGASDADLAREPLAGGLFRWRPGVRGLPSTPFAG